MIIRLFISIDIQMDDGVFDQMYDRVDWVLQCLNDELSLRMVVSLEVLL